ncbi:hypothetical protein PTKIN_Ptkin09bG0015300 [Pterospermum kingtungense]
MANSGTAAQPDDIILDILCRLDVEDLLRFRCVPKEFCSLIDNPYFIKLHLSRSPETNTNYVIIRECLLCFVDIDSLKTTTKLYHPLDAGIYSEILGSCNGFLALRSLGSDEDICLWNPSTRKSYILPVTETHYPPLYNNSPSTFRYGFGYEPISDDYKLVRMDQFDELIRGGDDITWETEVRVYSLSTNSWRRIKDFPFRFKYFQSNGILANHALHWVVRNKSNSDTKSIIVAFDLGTEEYRVVPLPDGLGEDSNMSITA